MMTSRRNSHVDENSGILLSKPVDRIPLRSKQNEVFGMQPPKTPAGLRMKDRVANLRTPSRPQSLEKTSQSGSGSQKNPRKREARPAEVVKEDAMAVITKDLGHTIDEALNADTMSNITFKSFDFSGVEVELSDELFSEDVKTLLLIEDQPCQAGLDVSIGDCDTTANVSSAASSVFSKHVDHSYHVQASDNVLPDVIFSIEDALSDVHVEVMDDSEVLQETVPVTENDFICDPTDATEMFESSTLPVNGPLEDHAYHCFPAEIDHKDHPSLVHAGEDGVCYDSLRTIMFTGVQVDISDESHFQFTEETVIAPLMTPSKSFETNSTFCHDCKGTEYLDNTLSKSQYEDHAYCHHTVPERLTCKEEPSTERSVLQAKVAGNGSEEILEPGFQAVLQLKPGGVEELQASSANGNHNASLAEVSMTSPSSPVQNVSHVHPVEVSEPGQTATEDPPRDAEVGCLVLHTSSSSMLADNCPEVKHLPTTQLPDAVALFTPKARTVTQTQRAGDWSGTPGISSFQVDCVDCTSTPGQVSSLLTKPWESPIPLPQHNSTTLGYDPKRAVDQAWCGDPPPLQEQLRRMGEMLIKASASGNLLVPAMSIPVERHSMGTSTSPVQTNEHSVNTSGVFLRQREFSVADASTDTDSLLWNLAPGSLQSVSRDELEQRLTSTHIMVEALCQQLSCARSHNQQPGPGPSTLRDKLVQTEHTELNQVVIYKELYVKALERIQELELGQEELRRLHSGMQDMKTSMAAVCTKTDEGLQHLHEIYHMASEGQDSTSKQMAEMRMLYGKCKERLHRMSQKVCSCVQERNSMRQKMEEAFAMKQAALEVTEQLRLHHATYLAEQERKEASHGELRVVLNDAYKQLMTLGPRQVESLQAANDLLEASTAEQCRLYGELSNAQTLLQRTVPALRGMLEKTNAAVREAKRKVEERTHALQERQQVQDELARARSDLEDASQQISNLNLQIMILSSEMEVLRQRSEEEEEERKQLQMKNTEMSASLSGLEASHVFLQQALSDQTYKLQKSLEESREATERADGLQSALSESEAQGCELKCELSVRDQRVEELQKRLEEQTQQLQHQQELCKQLDAVKEMNEFLLAENEMSQEQMVENEALLKCNMQELQGKKLQCEDLRNDLHHLQEEHECLQEELSSTQSKARSMLLDMGQQLRHATVQVAILHHRVRGIHAELQDAGPPQKSDVSSKPSSSQTPRCAAKSFVDHVMIASAAEDGEGESSTLTCVGTTTPKREEEEDSSNVLDLLAGLGEAISDLGSAVTHQRQLRDAENKRLQQSVVSLQGELYTLQCQHRSVVSDMEEQMEELQTQVEKHAAALQKKAEGGRSVKKLCEELDRSSDLLLQHKSDNRELRQEVSELRQSLQQAQLEVQILRRELSSGNGQSAQNLHAINEKIALRKEVDKLKKSLSDAEESNGQILERAKRHQLIYHQNERKLECELKLLDQMIDTVRQTLSSVPHVVTNCDELQKLVTFLG